MIFPERDNLLYDVRIICDIVDVLEGFDDDCIDRITVVLKPKGADVVLWVPFYGNSVDAYWCKGKCIPVFLGASYSFLEKTSKREYSVKSLSGETLDADSKTNGFTAVGQYLGFSGSDVLIQSSFLLLVSVDGDYSPAIGDWVCVKGEMSVSFAREIESKKMD